MGDENLLVMIQWTDITGCDGPWSDLEEAQGLKPALMTSVGQIVVNRNDSVVIASTWGEDNEFGNLNCIPKTAIRGWRELQLVQGPEDNSIKKSE